MLAESSRSISGRPARTSSTGSPAATSARLRASWPLRPTTRRRGRSGAAMAREIATGLGEGRGGPVLVREDEAGRRAGPGDGEVGIVVADRPLMLGRVGRGNLVDHFRARLER